MESGAGGVAPRAGEALLAELIRRRQKIDQDELEFSCLAAQFAETDVYDEHGFDSPISWLKAVCHMSGGAAADRVCVGEQIERLGQSTAAMAAGEIGFAHLALIARTSAALGERLDEARLLNQARKLNIFPFRNRCTHARHAGDAEGFVNEEKEGMEARSLTLTTADDGVVLVSLGELGRQARELELVLIDLLAAADQLCGDRLAGSWRSVPGPNLHVEIVRTTVW